MKHNLDWLNLTLTRMLFVKQREPPTKKLSIQNRGFVETYLLHNKSRISVERFSRYGILYIHMRSDAVARSVSLLLRKQRSRDRSSRPAHSFVEK